jgi:RimJ/RimL family protein N-acetyltransferase
MQSTAHLSAHMPAHLSAHLPDRLPESLQTERLLIRVARPGDGPIFNAAILDSRTELAPWLGWVTPAPTLEQSEASCQAANERFQRNEDLMAFFLLKDTGELVGGSGLHKANWTLRQFEVGYWARTRFRGTGLMTEGVRALARHAIDVLGAQRVFLTTDERNVPSQRLAERAGFELEGTLRKDRLDLEGRLRNTRVYAIVA